MKVKLGQAVKMFFGNSSLEMVYFEAVANSLDADATQIDIEITTKAYNQPDTLKLTIADNGVGFTDQRYKRFSKLLDAEESSHKGLGRLVYLCYFENVKISSTYENHFKKEFDFNESFNEDDVKIIKLPNTSESGTSMTMSNYTLSRLKQHSYIQPKYIKSRLLEEFYSRLFLLKQQGNNIKINIKSTIEDQEYITKITNEDILELKVISLDIPINFFDKFQLYYSISKVDISESSLIAAISVDNRNIKIDLIAEENYPQGYKMIFLLYSDWFKGKVNASRQNLEITDSELQLIQTHFRKKVASIIESELPQITKRNKEIRHNLVDKYPHLNGYFNSENIGYLSKADILKKAQEQFFKAQKDLLEATSLSDEQYKVSLELSARALTEYILFRQITINKLKSLTKENTEAELHKLFASMKVKFHKENLTQDLYNNNAWLLDDKYMTYESILSDKEMKDVIKVITEGEVDIKDDDRPDIALIFSNNPSNTSYFDVVIVELKKRGISLEENMKTVTQLEKRARKLMKYYNDKIQRIWYYGIIEFNDDVELALSGEWQELYSSGKMYYREINIAIQINPKVTLPIGVFMCDMDGVVNDADARNSAFLNLIKSKFST